MFGVVGKLKVSYYERFTTRIIKKIEMMELFSKRELLDAVNNIDDLESSVAAICVFARQTVGLSPFPVQIMAALACVDGYVIDMKTGEGKTLVAAIAAVILNKKGYVSVVATANEYLAERDLTLMSPLYNICEVSVGRVRTDRGSALCPLSVYYSHLTGESCISWLEDHLVFDINHVSHPQLLPSSVVKTAIIIDEIDHSLIESSSVNYSISAGDETSSYWQGIAELCEANGEREEFLERKSNVDIKYTQEFYLHVEDELLKVGIIGLKGDLYGDAYDALLHYKTAYTANYIFIENEDYVIKNSMVCRVDRSTGRIQKGGYTNMLLTYLHAKHRLALPSVSVDVISCSLQDYIGEFDLLTGMSGTAKVNALELKHAYNISTLEIPQNKETQRVDHGYVMFSSDDSRVDAVTSFLEVVDKRPTLVICSTEAMLSVIAKELIKKGIGYTPLTSANIELEGEILAEAGKIGSMVLTTRLCGRGTDIVCDDPRGLLLVIIGMGKTMNDDQQIVGRTGRQGAKGDTYFCLSVGDGQFGAKLLKNPVMVSLIQENLFELDLTVVKATGKLVVNMQKNQLASMREGRKRVALYNKPISNQLTLLMKKREAFLLCSNPRKTLEGLTSTPFSHFELLDNYQQVLGCELFDKACRQKMAEGLSKAWVVHHAAIVDIKTDSSSNAQASANINNFKKDCFESFVKFAESANDNIYEYTIVALSQIALTNGFDNRFIQTPISV